jgi:MFS-type transporter involved in bile tolerance (Atg22 family)
VALGIGQTLGYASSFYLPAILAVPMARDLALPSWAIFAGLSAALLIAGALAPMAGRMVDTHGGRPLLLTSPTWQTVECDLHARKDPMKRHQLLQADDKNMNNLIRSVLHISA